jgi:opacity protein-like surface antigen
MTRSIMTRLMWCAGMLWGGAVSSACLAVRAPAAELPRAATIESPAVAGPPIHESAGGAASTERRLYVTGMVGSSLAVHGDAGGRGPVAGGLLAGGLPAGEGAVGVAIPRTFGTARLEFEGRSGVAANASRDSGADSPAGESWSVMANAWRDLPITEHLAGYVGGGVGAVGIPVEAGQRGGVAALVGTGLTYAAHERMTFDLGYRFHVATAADGRRLPGNAAALASSEMLLSVRIYDPFRSWLK